MKNKKGKSGTSESQKPCNPLITSQDGRIRVRGAKIDHSGCLLRKEGTSGTDDPWTTHSTETD